MLHFLQEDISEDYHRFGDVSCGFTEKSDGTRASMEIIHLSELLAAMDEEMRSIEAAAADTFSAVSVMNRELDACQV